jgi:quercetin dioxygenase-like cupin family protein
METLRAHRVYTDKNGETHLTRATYKGTSVSRGETSIVPAGCTRLLEGAASAVVIREFPPGFKADYHTDPAQQHQLTLQVDGTALVECRDGGRVVLKPGDFTSVEDSVGQGHATSDAGGSGFVVFFVARPANI